MRRERASTDRQSRARGQSVVELALLLPILVMVLLGTLDLGRAYHYYSAVANATRAGGTYAMDATGFTGMTTPERVERIKDAIRNEIEGQQITVTEITVDPPDQVESGLQATVEVTYEFEFIIPLAKVFWGDKITLKYSSTIRYV